MRALRRLRGRRVLSAAGAAALTGTAVVALAACQPSDALDTATVSVATDQLATRQLEREHIPVRWLTCTGKAESDGSTDKDGRRKVTAVGVDCQGRTDKDKKIIAFGRVTGINGHACVTGSLTVKVDGRTVFSGGVLGDCGQAGGGQGKPPPPPSPTCTDKKGDGGHGDHHGGGQGGKHGGNEGSPQGK
ncbi:hypothetical protein ACR820_12470 [Streptomyces netropsis]